MWFLQTSNQQRCPTLASESKDEPGEPLDGIGGPKHSLDSSARSSIDTVLIPSSTSSGERYAVEVNLTGRTGSSLATMSFDIHQADVVKNCVPAISAPHQESSYINSL